MKYNRFLPLLIPFIVFLLFELFFFNPKMIYVAIVLSNLLLFFTVSQFTKASEIKNWINFFILPFLFLTSIAVYSILFPNKIIIQILFIINLVFLYYYLKTIYYFLITPAQYKDFTLQNISSYGNFLSFYFVSSIIYGLQSFLNIPVWPLIFILVFISALAVYQIIWVNKIQAKSAFIYILVSSLIIIELAWAISFLPLNFNVAGLILAICYYILIGIMKHHLLETLDKKTVKLYLFFGFGSILLILLTARWM